jgi:AraC-like DNA-binding protein
MIKQQFWHDPLLPFVESRRASQSRACYRPHTHPTLSIGAVDAGCSVLKVDGREDQALETGDVVLVPARCAHSCNPEPATAWSYQMLYLDVHWVAGLQNESPKELLDPLHCRPTHFRDPACYRRFCALNNLLFDQAPSELKEEALIDFVGSLIFAPATETEVAPRWVAGLAERLNRYCEQNWSIDELADLAAVSRYHLIRVFKRNIGLTPHAYQIDCRINKARQMLRDGEPLADLALHLGFSDQSHFQRAFRQRASITPGEYQRQMQH